MIGGDGHSLEVSIRRLYLELKHWCSRKTRLFFNRVSHFYGGCGF